MNDEMWKPVVGYEGIYEASSLGQIRRIKAPLGRTKIGKILKHFSWTGKHSLTQYAKTNLCNNGIAEHVCVHKIIAEAFFGKIPPRLEVNHKNGNGLDNRIENLEIVTSGENKLHACRVLRRRVGELHPFAKLNEIKVREIRAGAKIGMTDTELAKIYGVTPATIYSAVKNKTWNRDRFEAIETYKLVKAEAAR